MCKKERKYTCSLGPVVFAEICLQHTKFIFEVAKAGAQWDDHIFGMSKMAASAL